MKKDETQYKQWLHSSRWQTLRKLKLKRQPYCEDCLMAHRRRVANEVHHRTPVLSFIPSLQKQMMFNIDNLTSLCHDCHMRRHNRKEQKKNQEERNANRLEAFKKKYHS